MDLVSAPRSVYATRPEPVDSGSCGAHLRARWYSHKGARLFRDGTAGFFLCPENTIYGEEYIVIPPGSNFPPGTQAAVIIGPTPLSLVQSALSSLYQLKSVYSLMTAQSMGIASVISVGLPRQAALGPGLAHIREFDGLHALTGDPMRITMIMIVGQASAVKVLVAITYTGG